LVVAAEEGVIWQARQVDRVEVVVDWEVALLGYREETAELPP
jgi:hypothetical protein